MQFPQQPLEQAGSAASAVESARGRSRGWRQFIWSRVSSSPLRSLWNLEGIPIHVIAKSTWTSFFGDNLLGRSAELGFYFLFAVFPALFAACSILGLASRSASQIYDSLLRYLAVVVPSSALDMVLETFNQTTSASTRGKLTFGLVAAFWFASVGFSAIQDSLNVVYRVKEGRPYWKARISAVGVTILLSLLVTFILATFLAGDFVARLVPFYLHRPTTGVAAALLVRIFTWLVVMALLSLFFATIYYFGPNLEVSRWRWLTPGSAVGILGWVAASIGLRVYVHFFNNYSASYGSLGAVIILLTWFYLSGLMLLLGGEINGQIEAAVKERRLLAAAAKSNPAASTDISLITP